MELRVILTQGSQPQQYYYDHLDHHRTDSGRVRHVLVQSRAGHLGELTMNAKQREAAALREDFMRMAGRAFRMGYEAVVKLKHQHLAKKAQQLYTDCLAAANKCAKLEALAKRLS